MFNNIQMPKCSTLLQDPWPLLAVWLVGGILTLVVPVIQQNALKQAYYDTYGYAIEYEQQQRAYEEGQNGDNNNYNYGYPQCHWWQFKCRKAQFYYRQNADGGGGNNNNNGEYQLQYPGWYIFFGGQTEEDQRWREEQGDFGQSNGATKFVYGWSIVMFCTILFYGAYCLVKKRAVGPLVIMLCMFLQFSILTMVLVCQGVIGTDDRDLENSVYGFYGQMGILIVYTNNAYFWFCFVFAVVLVARAWWQRYLRKEEAQDQQDEAAALGGSYYKANDSTGEPAQGQMT